jgi:uncharacterized protein (TIGR00730 family)
MTTRITVFGGSQPRPGEPVYEDALRLGRLLAENGYIILNGGYIGTMEAMSRGATEAGGHVIGVTCDQIEAWRPVKANPWVTEVWHYSSLRERIFALIENSEAFVALPGGVGTLAEISLTWNLLLTHIQPPRPLILIGPGWQKTIQQFLVEQGEFIPENQRHWISYALDVDSAVLMLQQLLPGGKL